MYSIHLRGDFVDDIGFEERYAPRTINGGQIECKDVVGYCHCNTHPGYLLTKQLKDHECLKKECPWFEKNADSVYFRRKQLSHEKRKIAQKLKKLWLAHYIRQHTYDLWRNRLKKVENLSDLNKFKKLKIPVEFAIDDLLGRNFDNTMSDRLAEEDYKRNQRLSTSLSNSNRLHAMIESAIRYNEPINIVTKSGNAVIVSEDEYNSLLETVNLLSIPGMKEKLLNGKATPVDECMTEDEVQW